MTRLNRPTGDRPLAVHFDFKSPHAYLAFGPTRRLADELGIGVDWRPLTPDFSSLLGSAKLGESGSVVEAHRSADQWAQIKAFYLDCRRYASLHGLTLRGTVKIWDTNLAGIGMLWAKRQGDEVSARYMHGVFEPFWRRALDVEDVSVIRRVLDEAGADLGGFDEYLRGDGAAEHAARQAAALDAGVFGVPTFVVDDEIYFGREHLPRVRWHLEGRPGPAPDTAYAFPGGSSLEPASRLEVCIDFKCPYSYLALGPTLALARELGRPVVWRPKMAAAYGAMLAVHEASETVHRYRTARLAYNARDVARYAPHAVDVGMAAFDSRIAALGLLWLDGAAPERCERYVEAVFARRWRDGRPIDTVDAMADVMRHLGADPSGFASFVATDGAARLATSETALAARGVITTPTYLLDDEPFIGRHHLPLIRARLAQ